MRLPVLTAAALATAALLPCAQPAAAAEPGKPSPPAVMSKVGGKRLGLPGTQVAPWADAPELPEDVSARSWIVADAESGDVLAAHNAHWPLAPASTLKMLFADTLLPEFDADRQHRVTGEELAAVQPGSSLVGLKEELSYTVHELWLGVFLSSGNDAVHVLSTMNGGVEKTVRQMQRHAEELQAKDTHVVSPDGYDAPGQVSSAYDLTLIARSGLQKAEFREYCATVSAKFPGEFKGKKREAYAIQNTNRLLTGSHGLAPYQGLAGVKNGYTSKAGHTFTGAAERDGRTLLVTVMHPEESGANRVYEETAELLDWGFAAAGKVEPVGELVPPKSAQQAAAPPAEGHSKGISASGPQSGTEVEADGYDGIWTAVGVTAGVLLTLIGAALLVHRRWPPPVTAAGPSPGDSAGGAPDTETQRVQPAGDGASGD